MATETQPHTSGRNDSLDGFNQERQPLLTPQNGHAKVDTSGPPDGGFEAWLTVLAGFFIFVNSWGLSISFGVFLEHYRTMLLPDTPPSTLSWIGSIQSTFLMIVGLLTGPLTDRGYLRPVMIGGHGLIVLGMFMLSLSTKYYQVLLAQGFCVGLGAGAINVPAFAIISANFTTRRPIALGCASTGASIGGIVFPLVFRKLAGELGFARTVQIIGTINLLVAIPTLIIHCRKPGTRSPTAKMLFDPRGFLEPAFGTFVAGLFFQSLAFYIPLFFLTTYASVKVHAGKTFAFDLLAISNASSFFGRTVPFLLGSRITPIRILVFCEAMASIVLFSWIEVTTAAGMIAWTVAWGFLSGVLVTAPAASTAHPTLSPSLDVIGARLGMSWSTAAVGVLVGAPIAGALADVPRADFFQAQVFAGIVMAVAVLLMSIPLTAAYRFNSGKI